MNTFPAVYIRIDSYNQHGLKEYKKYTWQAQ